MQSVFTFDNPMPPPWLMYPHIHPYSIGWRMGYGEGYKYDFLDWLETLPKDELEQFQLLFPAPRIWRGYYSNDNAERENCFFNGVDFWNENGEPEYSVEWLMNQSAKPGFVFFWKPGDLENEPECCFGQWQYSEFGSDHLDYTCTEQYMMAEKARLFEDEKVEKAIMETSDPKQMKALGRKVKDFDAKVWDKVKYSIVLNGNYCKFSQNRMMREILIATDDKILVEASPSDTIWGIGYSKSSPEASDPQSWRGLNLLGFALMEVRDEIRSVFLNYDRIDWSEFLVQ